jgi:hypothetical protein
MRRRPHEPGGWADALAAAGAAPRCGARRKRTGDPCRAPAMPNGRCHKHGGVSTGPRTPEVDGEVFDTLREAEVVIESWRRHYNSVRPHASLGFRPPAPEVILPTFAAWPVALRRPASPTTQVVAPRPTLN